MGERILVVEDDEQIAAIVRDGLTRLGYRVELAADGPAALAAVRAQPCDLVVLDLMLPGMDGVEVCQRLHARGGPPVIMLTVRDAVAEKIAGWRASRRGPAQGSVSSQHLTHDARVTGAGMGLERPVALARGRRRGTRGPTV